MQTTNDEMNQLVLDIKLAEMSGNGDALRQHAIHVKKYLQEDEWADALMQLATRVEKDYEREN